MKKIVLTYILIFISVIGISQAPPIHWQHAYGGSSSDGSVSIVHTRDGGYIMAGSTVSNDGDVGLRRDSLTVDAWVVKTNAAGRILWQKSYGGSRGIATHRISQTGDGGYIMASATLSDDGDVSGHHGDTLTPDCWVVRLDSVGAIVWQRSLGGTWSDAAIELIQTRDGGYVMTASSASNDGDVSGHHGDSTSNDCWIVKLDTGGHIVWQRSIGGTNDEELWAIMQTPDGGYIAAGYTGSKDGDVTRNSYDSTHYDYWLVRLDTAGNIIWQKCYGGSDEDQAYDIVGTSDGGYVLAGYTFSPNDGMVSGNHGFKDCWLIRVDSVGALLWQHCYGGSRGDLAYSLTNSADGGFVVLGSTNSTNGDVTGLHGLTDFWVFKVDSAGSLDWQLTLGGSSFDYGASICQDSYGGYVVVGSAESTNGDVTGNHGSYDSWAVDLRPICYPSHVSDTMAICLGSSYGGHSGAGTYTDTLINMGGCDSIRDLLLTVYPTYSHTFYDTICSGSSYMWGGQTYTSSGVYRTILSSSHHCDSTSILHLTVSTLPVRPQITVIGDTLSTVVFAGVHYQWQMNGSDIAGATSGSIVAPTQAYYSVAALFGNGCISYSDTLWIYSLGLSDLNSSGQIQLHPNPASSSFTITADADMIGTPYTFSDMTGRAILAGTVARQKTLISIEGICSGVYTLQIKGQSYKVVKE